LVEVSSNKQTNKPQPTTNNNQQPTTTTKTKYNSLRHTPKKTFENYAATATLPKKKTKKFTSLRKTKNEPTRTKKFKRRTLVLCANAGAAALEPYLDE